MRFTALKYGLWIADYTSFFEALKRNLTVEEQVRVREEESYEKKKSRYITQRLKLDFQPTPFLPLHDFMRLPQYNTVMQRIHELVSDNTDCRNDVVMMMRRMKEW
jgi:hypothetical protein